MRPEGTPIQTLLWRTFTPAIVVLGPVSALREDFSWYAGKLVENGLG